MRTLIGHQQTAGVGDIQRIALRAAKGDHGRVFGRHLDALKHLARGRNTRDGAAVHQRAPVVAGFVAGRTVDAPLHIGGGKETPLVADLSALQVEVVNPDRLIAAVRQVHAPVVGRKRDPVADDEVTIHAMHMPVRIEPEQFGLATDDVRMHAGTPVAPAAVAFAIVEHQPPIPRQRIGERDRVCDAVAQLHALEARAGATDQAAVRGEHERANVTGNRKAFDLTAHRIEAPDRRCERVDPIQVLVTRIPLRRLAQNIGAGTGDVDLDHGLLGASKRSVRPCSELASAASWRIDGLSASSPSKSTGSP